MAGRLLPATAKRRPPSRLSLRRRRKSVVRSAKNYSPQSTRVLCGKYSCTSRRVLRRAAHAICLPSADERAELRTSVSLLRRKPPRKAEPAKSDGRQSGRRKRQDKIRRWRASPWHARHRRSKKGRAPTDAPLSLIECESRASAQVRLQ